MHISVLSDEVISCLKIRAGGVYVDCTLGMGGHTKAMLEAGAAKVYGIDRDLEALEQAKAFLKRYSSQVKFLWSNFRELNKLIPEKVDGVLFDLGLSSFHLERPERGFSFRLPGSLDMRFNRQSGLPCFKLIRRLNVRDLEFILSNYGEERYSRRIARLILEQKPKTTQELQAIVSNTVPHHKSKSLARVFQALRIFVNDELNALKDGLKGACKILKVSGRLCAMSYHSLEDRIIKQYLRDESNANLKVCPTLALITKKPVRPSPEEVSRNPRSRSAKLRCAEKI